MQEIFKTMWGQTKLTRSLLSMGALAILGVLLVRDGSAPNELWILVGSWGSFYFGTRSGGGA